MSRIGNRVLQIPEGVTVTVLNDIITVKGPKGELTTHKSKAIDVLVEDQTVKVTRQNEIKTTKQMHGTVNANISNMMEGVKNGYEKGLEILGVGYRFQTKGRELTIAAGYSHPVIMEIPMGLEIETVSNTEITLKGIDKILVGEFAANVRKVRKPEPYKGKGIRYKGEHIIRKEGKKASK